jgi:hypothetical protein
MSMIGGGASVGNLSTKTKDNARGSYGNVSQMTGGVGKSTGNLSNRSGNSFGKGSTGSLAKSVRIDAEEGHEGDDRSVDTSSRLKRRVSRKNSRGNKEDAMKTAKVLLEYDAWVGKKDSPTQSIKRLNSAGNPINAAEGEPVDNFYDQ